ncbi:hypothetical protein AOB60_17285 [Streptomyces noursei]|uniref:Uncharacterized protein n=1 Tax=Streptomyces noursei TaxID=1971 RepID=A0A2N8PMN0_STRNR|nr:hypothetical protein AOB60_17285 [Streptomyces noursei]
MITEAPRLPCWSVTETGSSRCEWCSAFASSSVTVIAIGSTARATTATGSRSWLLTCTRS